MLLIMVSVIAIAQQILLVKLIRNSDWFKARLEQASLGQPTYDPWIAIRPQLGANTPGGCLHIKPEPVVIADESEPMNWICSDCLVKLENDDQAVVTRKATDLKKKLREDADQEFRDMFQPPSPEERERAEALDRAQRVIYGS